MAKNDHSTNKVKRQVTNLMVRDYEIMEKGYDFMGYRVDTKGSLSFHHMIISRCKCKKINLDKCGFLAWNGAILVRETSHDYLHVIEKVDRPKFDLITTHMIMMNDNGRLDKANLRCIGEVLDQFEAEHADDTTSKGKRLIRPSWIEDRIRFN